MSDILEEMAYQVPNRFKRFDVLLSAYMAIFPVYLGIAIQAIFFSSFFQMAQSGKFG